MPNKFFKGYIVFRQYKNGKVRVLLLVRLRQLFLLCVPNTCPTLTFTCPRQLGKCLCNTLTHYLAFIFDFILFLLVLHYVSVLLHFSMYCQLRAKRAQSLFKDVLLRTRRALSIVKAPFWFSREHLLILLAPFWLSTDNMHS